MTGAPADGAPPWVRRAWSVPGLCCSTCRPASCGPLCMTTPLAWCPKQAAWSQLAGSSKSTSVPLPRRNPKCPRPQVRRSPAAACLPAAWWPVVALVAALVIPTEVLVVVVGPPFAPWRREVPESTSAPSRALCCVPHMPLVAAQPPWCAGLSRLHLSAWPVASFSAAISCSSARRARLSSDYTARS